MTTCKNYLLNSIAVFLCILLAGCQQPGEPTVSFASAEEIKQLINEAETSQPMGKPTVDTYEHESGMTFVYRQPLMLQGGGGGPISVVHCCTGSCKYTPGNSQPCTATGCDTGGKTCGKISCSGGCSTSRSCTSCDSGMVIRW